MSEFKEYKSGDKVIVRKNKKLCLPNFNYMAVHTIVHVVDIPLGQRVQLDSFPEGSYVSSEAVDLATDEEIAAGHRIDMPSLPVPVGSLQELHPEFAKVLNENFLELISDDSHTENHISPLCKSKDV